MLYEQCVECRLIRILIGMRRPIREKIKEVRIKNKANLYQAWRA